MKTFEPVPDLRIGHIVEVSGTSVRVELDGAITELTRSFEGRVYLIGQVGSIVKIHFGRRLLFGFVTMLRMRSEELAIQPVPIPPEADQRVMEVELFAEGIWSSGAEKLAFTRGVCTYPLPLQGVYLITRAEADLVYRAAEGDCHGAHNPMVAFATYFGAESSVCRANIDKMFGLHCAVLGSTGSGKSGAVATILHRVLETPSIRPRVVLIDPHGEYGHAFGERGKVFRAYDPIGNDESIGERIILPFWLMSAEEFRSLIIGKTEFEATSQHNVVYKALTHARMVAAGLVEPAPTSYGYAVTDENSLEDPRMKHGVTTTDLLAFDRDKPRPFSLQEFQNHIEFIQAAKFKNGKTERVSDSEFSKGFRSVLDKLSVLRRDPRINFLMDEWKEKGPSLPQVLGQFVGSLSSSKGEEEDLRIVDISGLPNEVAGPLAASIARLLFQYKLYQASEERKKDPVLLICEEAHRYVPDRGEAEYAAAQKAIRRIAKEGRKYGLGLMLVSQRPADVESTVVSQCNTWLVLRLTNAADHQQVTRCLPDNLSGMAKILPALARQEALFVGEGACLPARIRIDDLPISKLPKSNDIPFAAGWANERLSNTELSTIAARMASEDYPQPQRSPEIPPRAVAQKTKKPKPNQVPPEELMPF